MNVLNVLERLWRQSWQGLTQAFGIIGEMVNVVNEADEAPFRVFPNSNSRQGIYSELSA